MHYYNSLDFYLLEESGALSMSKCVFACVPLFV
jgi:hypothetical protein